jgi:uncharacterized membrane protein YheB (UPF0754 family)
MFNNEKTNSKISNSTISNSLSFLIMLSGLILYSSIDSGASKYILSFGLFSFSGGITNWLAVKMLFDKIPFLYGSGIIPGRFKEIRKSMKDTIMTFFFDIDYMNDYLNDKSTSIKKVAQDKIKQVLNDKEFDNKIVEVLKELTSDNTNIYSGMILMFTNNGTDYNSILNIIKPLMKDFFLNFINNTGHSEFINIITIRSELDKLLDHKMEFITAGIVKVMIENVIRDHLTWLIIWGNIFGGVIGLITQSIGFGL